MSNDTEAFMKAQKEIVEGCARCLARHDPQLQGAAIAELFVRWLHGHHALDGTPESTIRSELKQHTMELVDGFLEIYDQNVKEFRAKHAH